jgi:hypothetical protein
MQLEVTMHDFAGLCRQRKYGIDYLVEQFAGKFGCADGGMARETIRQFFTRTREGRYAPNVIPYRCLIAFYQRELGYLQDSTGQERRCACGCGQRIFGRKVYAGTACRKRAERIRKAERVTEKRPPLLRRSVTFRPGGHPGTPPPGTVTTHPQPGANDGAGPTKG